MINDIKILLNITRAYIQGKPHDVFIKLNKGKKANCVIVVKIRKILIVFISKVHYISLCLNAC